MHIRSRAQLPVAKPIFPFHTFEGCTGLPSLSAARDG